MCEPQGNLFLETPNPSYFERLQEIANSLVYDIFNPSLQDTPICIIDPFFHSEVLHKINDGDMEKIENDLWANVLTELVQFIESGRIMIITKEDVSEWQKTLYYTKKLWPPTWNRWEEILHLQNSISVDLIVLKWKENKNNCPKELHDRFILFKDRGWHLGNSLNGVFSKDFTITSFDDRTFDKVKERFNNMWEICLKTGRST